jgi:predicted enzyme related to lactoylglutathione lyase
MQRAMKFYKDAFGWEYIMPQATCPETGEKIVEPDFYMFQKGNCHGSFRKVDSFNHISPSLHPDNADKQKIAVTVTITTDNMEESLKAVEEAGGSVYM